MRQKVNKSENLLYIKIRLRLYRHIGWWHSTA
nr:MAG TPA: JAB1/Mov34/MPN/PAD-1 ubiquitin protease [Caudoviricetes sp.]